jgi:ABC-type glycerol-3-phosphate transport system substrate-binding protein
VELERNNEQNYYDKLVTSILGGSAPDIARVEPPKAAQYVAAGYAANLGDLVPADVRSDFFEGTLEPLTKDGSLYGIPQDVAVLSLYYRTDLFEAAGIASPPATWDELVTAAKALTKDDVYGIGLFGGWGAFEFYPWFWQAGGEMLKDEGDKPVPAFNSPEGVAALQFWVDLVKTHRVMPEGTATQGEDEVKGPFIAGKIAMFTSGPWSLASLKEVSEIEGKWAVAPLPKAQQAASVLGGMDVILLEQSEHKGEAAKFLEYWLSEEVQLDWAKSLGFLPVRKSLYEDPFFQSDPFIQAFAKELEVARSRPTIAQAGEIDDLFGQAVQAALSGAMTPKEALDDAAAKATEVLAGS